ncbi:DUF805 domain-containing protein [Parvularcula sp. ZS-1/3]|uniref:DUF805 domain-containing protein n=1 Tax=Parvularcula mediterranea TaxID=2732508 RepID=A0A7Y3W4B3_9PROT|nr:DUF805 domain-containing protein [Parvularcula mediterranea]NNU15082.1 DUF805 domain-containing protein [Parvularcula mediterranea]
MFDFLFNPSGRISRKGYALGFVPAYLILVILPSLLLPQQGLIQVYTTVIGLFFFWPALIAVPFKRFHDLNLTGWWHFGIAVLVGILSGYGTLPIIVEAMNDPDGIAAMSEGKAGWEATAAMFGQLSEKPDRLFAAIAATAIPYIEMIILMLLPGQRQENRFGQDPLVSGMGFAD